MTSARIRAPPLTTGLRVPGANDLRRHVPEPSSFPMRTWVVDGIRATSPARAVRGIIRYNLRAISASTPQRQADE